MMSDADLERESRRPGAPDRDEFPRELDDGRRRSVRSPSDSLQPEHLPPPPAARKRRPGLLAAASGFLTFLLVGFFGAGYLFVVLHGRLREPGPLTADKVLYIAPGTDVPDIINLLDSGGVISNPLLFSTALFVEGSRSKLKAGEYLFKQNASLQDVMDTMVSGRQILHPVTVPEGLTSEQIVGRLRENEFLTGEVREVPREGTLLPETYKISRSESRSGLLRKMAEDQRRLVEQVWARRSPDLPVKTPAELVTLASIVERETGKADERPRVAAVFINRLNKKMRLQSDPTIVYGLVQGRGTLGRGILRSEVDKYTPYNTYQIDGLPPGPIANPGRAALEAVANPSRTSELYFVADGTGGHVFASTLDEHNRNVARWRQLEREAREKGAAEVDKSPALNAPPAPSGPTSSPARPGPRGDLQRDTFGALPSAAALTTRGADFTPSLRPVAPPVDRLASGLFGDNWSARTIASIVAERSRPKPAAAPLVVAERPPEDKPVAALAYGPDIEALGFQVRGMRSRTNLLDGPVEGNDAADPIAEEARMNEMRAVAALEASGAPRRARGFDASEGTALDPLRNKNWDLNHTQAIPPLTLQ